MSGVMRVFHGVWCCCLMLIAVVFASTCTELRTQIVVRVRPPLDTSVRIRSMRFNAVREGVTLPLFSGCFNYDAGSTDPRPYEVALQPKDPDVGSKVHVTVTLHERTCEEIGSSVDRGVLSQVAVVRFAPRRTLILWMPFTLACRMPPFPGCATTSACDRMTCEDDGDSGPRCACEQRDLPVIGAFREPGDRTPPRTDAGVDTATDVTDVPRADGEAGVDVPDPGDVGPCDAGCAVCADGRCVNVAALAAGYWHTCARMTDGTVRCWGWNAGGQAGSPAGADHALPTPITLSGARELVAGGEHACALTGSSLWCWGYNGDGQLGQSGRVGSTEPTPLEVTFPSGVTPTQASGGARHTCATSMDGRVFCWGLGDEGQRGGGAGAAIDDRPMPVLTAASTELRGVRSVSAGGVHTCARMTDGSVRCWGGNTQGQLGDGTRVGRVYAPATSVLDATQDVVAGRSHTCARMMDDTVMCWGDNTYGQIGDGTGEDRSAPTRVPELTGVTQLALGTGHTCALLADRTLRCWGRNDVGQLGDGARAMRTRPVAVTGLTNVLGVVAGDEHTCALLMDGSARCWGRDSLGQLGTGATLQRTPATVGESIARPLSGITSVAVGPAHACATLTGNELRCWGANERGQAIGPSSGASVVPLPDRVLLRAMGTPVADAVEVAPGRAATCARGTTGALRCWGYPGESGGFSGEQLTAGVTQVKASRTHACAIVSGVVRCWGDAEAGALGGDPPTGDAGVDAGVTPSIVALDAGAARAVAVGYQHTCALVGGGAWCWGLNGVGQLGVDDSSVYVRRPARLTLVTSPTIEEIGCGTGFTCVRVMGSGDVICWGDGTVGTPSGGAVMRLAATQLAVGELHACALAGGRVQCWGLNNFGQLGTGDVAPRSAPTEVTALALPAGVSVARLAVGGEETCAVLSDATARCWGRNTHGQVGNGVAGVFPLPARVLWR